MATHSSTLARKIPWMEEPGRLLSMESHRVGHDWSDLAAANLVDTMVLLEGATSVKESWETLRNTQCFMMYLQNHSPWEIVALNKAYQKTCLISIFRLFMKYQDGYSNLLIKESGCTKISDSKFSLNLTRSDCIIMAWNLCFSVSFWEIQQQQSIWEREITSLMSLRDIPRSKL